MTVGLSERLLVGAGLLRLTFCVCLTHQNEKIKEEQAERDAKKKKDTSEKEELQTMSSEIETSDTMEGTTTNSNESGRVTKEEILDAIDVKVEELKEELVEKAAEIEMGERELSPEEMESISQLLSADPVVKERNDLARIKQAMREEAEAENEVEKKEKSSSKTIHDKESFENDDGDKAASLIIEKLETEAAKESDKLTSFSTEYEVDGVNDRSNQESSADNTDDIADEISNDDHEDPVVARLKKRIESMVDKIELQLSDVQVKIGDKLHYLDKDMDGILSRVEMADVLSQVLKDLSFEEALEIADEIVRTKMSL